VTALQIGDVIEVNDDRDYRFGIGPLFMRVTMLGQQRTADGEWVDLEGLELRRDGSQISQHPRSVSVRVPGVRLRPGGPNVRW